MHHDALHRGEAGGHVLRVGIGLHDVLALDVDAPERAIQRRVDHVGNAQAGLGIQRHAPLGLVDRAHRRDRDVAIAGQFVREAAHVAAALHVVLAAQRVHADATAADVAGRHRQVGERHHRGGALAVLGDAQPVVDRAVARLGVEPRRRTDRLRRHAAELLHFLRAVARFGDERRPVGERLGIAALAHEGLVHQALGDDDMRQCGQHRDVGAGTQRQVMAGLDMRHAHQVDAARIDHDQLGAFAQPALHARGEHRMTIGRIGADDHDHVGLIDGVEILRAGRGAERACSAHSRSANGRRARRYRCCCCGTPGGPASAPDTSLRRCSATR